MLGKACLVEEEHGGAHFSANQLGTSRAGLAVGRREWGAEEDEDQSRVAERGRGRSQVEKDSGLAMD